MKRSSVITLIVVGVLLVAVVAGFGYALNRKAKAAAEADKESTAVQKVLMKDLERDYPPTAKEVVKYFAEIAKCCYNEDYTDEQLAQMVEKVQGIYDDELVANNPTDEYLEALRTEIADMKNDNCTITNYTLSSSLDVEEFSENGYECARLYCTFYIKRGTQGTTQSMEEFVLRKDENSHWRIYGWKLAE